MLTEIHIKNYTIIDEIRLDLKNRMSVFTGETGAGKSIIIDAATLALGERLSGSPVRKKCEQAHITLSFDISDIPEAQQLLKKYAVHDGTQCLIQRIIYSDGRSKSYINHFPTSIHVLRELGEALIDIHGQHEFQSLLKPASQMAMLDRFAEQTELVQQLNQLVDEWLAIKQEFTQAEETAQQANARIELLTYQIHELDELRLEENGYEAIVQEHKQLANRDFLIMQCQKAVALLSEDSQTSIRDLLCQVHAWIDPVQEMDKRLSRAGHLLQEAMTETDEAVAELRSFLDHIDNDPERLNVLNEQLNKFHQFARKHRIKPEMLRHHYQQLRDELSRIQSNDERLDRWRHELSEIESRYYALAAALSKNRQKAAKVLSKQVTESMQALGFSGGKFSVQLISMPDRQLHRNGLEKIELLVSTNPGQPLQPLTQIASGGELSRLSLAIQVITAKKNSMPTIVFDEVDVGIGGATAEKVGHLLRELGRSTQILCITHLAQVAAKGHHHWKVKKQSTQNETSVEISYLSFSDRVQEIARMSGGIKITAQAVAHAEEMLRGSEREA